MLGSLLTASEQQTRKAPSRKEQDCNPGGRRRQWGGRSAFWIKGIVRDEHGVSSSQEGREKAAAHHPCELPLGDVRATEGYPVGRRAVASAGAC